MRGQREIRKQGITLTGAIVLPSRFIFFITEEIDISAHELYPLYPFHDLIVRLCYFLACVFDHFQESFEVGHADADAVAFYAFQLFWLYVLSVLEAELDLLAKLIDRIIVDFDNLINVIGYANFQIRRQFGKFLRDDRINVLIVILHYALYDH